MPHSTRSLVRRLAPFAAVLAVASLSLTTVPSGADAAQPKSASHLKAAAVKTVAKTKHARAPRGYLALGDSVPFGYRESTNAPAPSYSNPTSFVGFPEDVASGLHLKVANAACPGETTASFITAGAQSNGCENQPGGGPGYRSVYPLHVKYGGTQLEFATTYLKQHPGTGLVSLMVGANDGFLCQSTTADHCASESGALLTQVGNNVTKILKTLRHKAHYKGAIVLVTYYSLDYSDALVSLTSQAIDNVLISAATPYDVKIADGYGAFQTAAAQAGGDSCKAGLLTTLSGGGCGVHPSVAGQALLAQAVEKAYKH